MTKPTFENGRIVPATSGRVKSSQGEWTPRTPDAFERTYEHVMRVGVANCKASIEAYQKACRKETLMSDLRKLKRIRERLEARKNGTQVVQLDNV